MLVAAAELYLERTIQLDFFEFDLKSLFYLIAYSPPEELSSHSQTQTPFPPFPP
jgi:hypothetical protein